jgi:hypothetical protein
MQSNGLTGSIVIHDLADTNGRPTGTQVEIKFPIKSN